MSAAEVKTLTATDSVGKIHKRNSSMIYKLCVVYVGRCHGESWASDRPKAEKIAANFRKHAAMTVSGHIVNRIVEILIVEET